MNGLPVEPNLRINVLLILLFEGLFAQALGNQNLHSRQNGGHYQDYEGKRSRKQEEKDENEQAGQS